MVANARLAGNERAAPLEVSLLGNPVVSDKAEVDIRGAAGARLWLTLTDENGKTLLEKRVEQAAEVEHQSLPLNGNVGVYLLNVRTLDETATIKILKR